MPRIRTVKPEIAKHEKLFDAEVETGMPMRYFWAVLPCFCDREGRFEWRPRRLTADIFPYDESTCASRVLDALTTRGFIAKYRVGDGWFGWIPTFTKHQVVNHRESASDLPPIEHADEVIYEGNHTLPDACPTRAPRVTDASSTGEGHARGEGKGREGKGKEGDETTNVVSPPTKVAGAVIPMTKGTHRVTEADAVRYGQLYPGVDLEQEFRNMVGWLEANPARRSETPKGVKQRIANWMSKAAQRPPSGTTVTADDRFRGAL